MSIYKTSVLWLASSLALTACASHSPSSQTPSFTTSATTVSSTTVSAGWQTENTSLSADKATFIAEVSQRYQIPASFVEKMLDSAKINDRVLRLMSPKTTAKVKRHWATYRSRFVEPIRIRKGTAFWNNNRGDLAEAERQYGVPAAVIAAIIGVETVYGEQMGTFNIRDALYSLGFYYPDPNRPDKGKIFRNQLAALIALTYTGHFDGYHAEGSFAGAYGMGQFMPVSIMHYAVDADNNGRIELDNSVKDAIFSVANFLAKHGWQRNMPIFAPVKLPANPAKLVDGDLEAHSSWAQLHSKGATTSVKNANWQQGLRLDVIDLRDDVYGNHEYRVATQNFFAITKYNRSYFYAASVADLATVLANQQLASGYQVTKP
ncbi:lytic murein transglycosylase B [Pelistega europaea]|uniref:Lytic murein transglycosylase B n=1 Tax=Pelistega europaea TaxID=106147 RepID=A0A7Y4P5I2_9BURK|nr:lytic murein transglycosylase B [Pelistega europaea]NOL48884.1 lytic murein transglycosylase B [Pelistega europaea]